MTTIPARLAQMSRSSTSLADAQARARTLYRDFYRGAVDIVEIYDIPVSIYDIRIRVRQEFERNKHITDLNILDVALLKGRQEYQEIMNVWKNEPHIMAYFNELEANPQPQTFYEKFLAGRDENNVHNFH